MKIIERILKALRRNPRPQRKDVQYYDHYTALGSILGGYCGLLKFGGKDR